MRWWQQVPHSSPIARLAGPTDRPVLAGLIANTWRRHGILAVEEQVALLNNGLSVFAFDHYEAMGFLGLAPRIPVGNPPEQWAEVAMLIVASGQSLGQTVRLLTETALDALRRQGVTGLACLAADRWVREALSEVGFLETDQVLTYTRPGRKPLSAAAEPEPANLRRATPADVGTILAINAAAFAPFWRYDTATTTSWLLTADHARIAEVAGRPAGFALTANANRDEYAQLMRVAVHPSYRGHGIGRQLVADAIRFVQECNAPGLTLNTQASNTVSRRLYESLGFHLAGASLTVMMYWT